MPYIYVGVALTIVLTAAWMLHARQTAANSSRTRRSQVAQKAKLARLQPAEESRNQTKPRDKRRKFGNR